MVERADDLEFLVEGKKRLDQVLLVPESLILDDPFLDVVARREDVVDVDDDARLEPAEHLQYLEQDVPLGTDHV